MKICPYCNSENPVWKIKCQMCRRNVWKSYLSIAAIFFVILAIIVGTMEYAEYKKMLIEEKAIDINPPPQKKPPGLIKPRRRDRNK